MKLSKNLCEVIFVLKLLICKVELVVTEPWLVLTPETERVLSGKGGTFR